MSLFQRTNSYIKPYKGTFSFAIVFNFLYAIFNVIAFGFMMPILKILFDEKREYIKQLPIYSGNITDLKDYISDYSTYYLQALNEDIGAEKALLMSCVFFLIAFLLRNIFSFFSEYFLIDLRSGVSRDFRKEIHNKILELPTSYFSEKKKGDFITRFSSDVGEIEGSILNGLIEFIRSPIMILVSLISLFFLNYQLTLFTLIVFPVMGTIISLIGKSLKKYAGKAQTELGSIISYFDESLSFNKIIKIFNAEEQISARFNQSLDKFRDLSQKVLKRKALASPTSEFLGGITIALLVYFGGTLSLRGEGLKGSEFIFYISLFYTMLDPIKRLTKSISDFQKGEISAQRVFEVIDTVPNIKDNPNAIAVNSFNHEISFKNITFSYEDKEVLKDFSLTIAKGKTIALVGQSGSGKSTLANLITRFYDVSTGEISLDGINIKNLKLKDYRSLFGLVTQESILFNDTVFNNISLGSPDATLEKVIEAAKVANAHEFISQLPEGYKTHIGESGGKLSGGQRQRLSIARAVLKNPPIMVLDEATSALDTESERWVQDALDHMLENRTSLVIAHRLSTIKKADVIVVMEQGNIIEQGSHSELIAQNGKYAKLIELQGFEH